MLLLKKNILSKVKLVAVSEDFLLTLSSGTLPVGFYILWIVLGLL